MKEVSKQALSLNSLSFLSLSPALLTSVHTVRPDLLLAYGVVYRARALTSSNIVALKQIRLTPEERQNGIPITALREISLLRSLSHENIINVMDVAVGTEQEALDEIFMVMEYCEQVGSFFHCAPYSFFFFFSFSFTL